MKLLSKSYASPLLGSRFVAKISNFLEIGVLQVNQRILDSTFDYLFSQVSWFDHGYPSIIILYPFAFYRESDFLDYIRFLVNKCKTNDFIRKQEWLNASVIYSSSAMFYKVIIELDMFPKLSSACARKMTLPQCHRVLNMYRTLFNIITYIWFSLF